MANLNAALDDETCSIIEQILKDCKCHSLSISVRSPTSRDAEIKTFKLPTLSETTNSDQLSHLEYTVTDEGDTIFAIASITKYMVAVALKIAEERAKESIEDNPYANFSRLHGVQLRTLYNKHKAVFFLMMVKAVLP